MNQATLFGTYGVLPSLERVLGQSIVSKGGVETRFNCPKCGDAKHHLYVNMQRERFICFRCDWRGTLGFLCGYLGIHGLSAQNLVDRSPGVSSVVHLPDMNFVQVDPSYPTVYSYLLSRGITPDQILWYRISLSLTDLGRRIYFLNFDVHGRVNYWVGRLYRPGDTGPKYKNPAVQKGGAIFNLTRALEVGVKELIITEGPISAIAVGRNGVATYGKCVTDAQVEELVRAKVSLYIVAFDGDATREGYRLVRTLSSRGCAVSYEPLPDREDPASLGFAYWEGREYGSMDTVDVLRRRCDHV